MIETHSSNNARVCFLFLSFLHISPQVCSRAVSRLRNPPQVCSRAESRLRNLPQVCSRAETRLRNLPQVCSRAESRLRNLPQVIPEQNHICGTFRKSFPSGIAFAEPSANISFFDFWLAHHVFIDVLKRAFHASDCHALYPIYTIDADDFTRL